MRAEAEECPCARKEEGLSDEDRQRITGLDNICPPRTVQPSSRAFDWPGVEKWDGDIYRESSHIQLTSHVFPPSDEKDCSIRDDLGEMLSQT